MPTILADALEQTLQLASEPPSLISRPSPTLAELAAARRAANNLAALGRAQVLHTKGADSDDHAGDRNFHAG
jgi:hypothetical protein